VTIDLVIFAHLFFVALGFGCAARLDLEFFLSRKAPPSDVLLNDAERSHRLIILAMIGMWTTGIALIYLRTGFVFENISPKLWTKVIVVTVLSVNSLVISKFAMPRLHAYADVPVMAIPMRSKLPMAVVSAVSTISWLSALALGAVATLKTQPWDVLLPIFGAAYSAAIIAAIAVCIVVPQPAPQSDRQLS